ncbi:von Willebrand factor A domain-containing protein 8-like isoform X2 [Pomacea canaliculata]|uniref:von Willebrand factor A domain-containing protein 8-like isoform X2 n=1 Tax=Pomacea canaliculata TaxID=400727 RepID=UPI000D731D0A|nr:von Willebrand factor A domain-containing protein 8-like isoform X2 [Pomacea canaliculata]
MRIFGFMSLERANRRLRHLQAVIKPAWRESTADLQVRWCSSESGSKRVSIGDVSIQVKDPKAPELVPRKYYKKELPQTVLRHLRWIMQKDALGQDIFLIGPPGPFRRQIALMYLELTKREHEYVSLSRDTTESDLKQRREIHVGTAYYADQCAVRAALEGRVLLLEGVEKAERNVLPVLNNLLENREMQLDDGRFLVAAERYDKLLEEHSKEELDALKLVRVSEFFRVIALGLPVPHYQGNPLDPPLRSRFQARDVYPLPFKEIYASLQQQASHLPSDRISQILSFATTLQQRESESIGLPDFPMDNLPYIVKLLDTIPELSSYNLLQRLYPFNLMLGKEGKTAVLDALAKFELVDTGQTKGGVGSIRKDSKNAQAEISVGNKKYDLTVSAGHLTSAPLGRDGTFVPTGYHDAFLSEMLQSHLVKDFCIIGPRDMTSRDLLQQRTTLPNGDTVWRPAPLMTAAVEGSLAVLDGVHRINQGSFSVLHRLVNEREVQLFDGTRLLSEERFEAVKEETGLTNDQLAERNIFPIHPSFRIVALAEPPVVGSSKQQWLSPEMLTMFLYHHMRPLSRDEEYNVIVNLVPGMPDMSKVFDFVHKLRDSHDGTLNSLASSMSTRQLLRIARRMSKYPSEDLYGMIHKACLARFLPRLAHSALEQTLTEIGIVAAKVESTLEDFERAVTCEVKDGILRVGNTSIPVYNPDNRTKVPNILFYENPQHLSVMEDMMKDFTLGEHLLLVGNQGVGKNKIVDRFLQLLNRPREYIQLHRDTTVQTLTLQPTVKEGIIIYEDSPLVKAVKSGNVLVIDEADKAPTHVTCILKTLVESGEMHLSDGRRIVSSTSGIKPSDTVIVSHPDFRMIVLANRPGFPFLGNDFFGAMGDIFSCHAIDNPDVESEMAMLRQYGPHVPEATLHKLVLAFGELRNMADQGLISYPYSTREVVNIVRHLEKYPSEGLTTVVKNVFDFDQYNKELKETLIETMQKHGIPLGASQASIALAKELELPKFEVVGEWTISSQGLRQKTSLMMLPTVTKKLQIKGPVPLYVESKKLERTETRASVFTEQEAYWTLPIDESNVVCDLDVSKAGERSPGQNKHDIIYVATANPIGLYCINPFKSTANYIDLYDVFPSTSGGYRPRVKILALAAPLDDCIVLHEEVTNVVLMVNMDSGDVTRLLSDSLPETPPEKRRFTTVMPQVKNPFRMCTKAGYDPKGTVLFFKLNEGNVEVLNILEGLSHSVSLPIKLQACHNIDISKWLLIEADSNQKYLLDRKAEDEFILQPVTETGDYGNMRISQVTTTPMSHESLSLALEKNISSPNRIVVTPNSYASILVGFPELGTVEVYSALRDPLPETSDDKKYDPFSGFISKPAAPNAGRSISYLPKSGQVVRALPAWKVPKTIVSEASKSSELSGYLEVADLPIRKLRYIPVPGSRHVSPYISWLMSASEVSVFIAPLSDDGLVSVDVGGCVRTWETSVVNLKRSLQEWRNMIGYEDSRPLQVNEERESGRDHENIDLKHGQIDPQNMPHVGGGNWAGGVGGSNTAGLGGFGGPYRLDAGHQVFQVPQWEKDAVPESVRQAAREMAQKAYRERLREIEMSEFDGETYEKFSSSVRRQVQSLRVILDSLQAKGKERQWLKNQAYGDLDDAKLIEGLTGEKSVYKRRGEKEPEMGTPQELPKRLRLVVDVSGSMYRFNGHDSRLTREMEATLMMMEAFENYENKIKYDIYGHSGETSAEPIVKADKPPKNNKERLNVLKTMHAHSQFCISGDNTLEAVKDAIEKIGEEEADEHFVILLSDANFDRYGIRPSRFGEILTSNEDVNAYAIFIGSLGDQAVRLNKQLPMGHSYVCMDTRNLPMILQQIFTSTMLS